MALNPDQEKVASHFRGRILAIAGPGSGKTRTLTERTNRLVRRGVDPSAILCLTFTNKARDEMRERIAASAGKAADKVNISNFHGLCGKLLRKHGQAIGYTPRLTICDADDQLDLILQIARRRGLEPTKPAAKVFAFLANEWRENHLGAPEALEVAAAARRPAVSNAEQSVIRAYVDQLRQRNQTDFSGMLSETLRLLRESEETRAKLRRQYHFIQVDEYQDTNRCQNEIVELLASDDDNILAVGDADQSIYEWRGATPDAIPQFIRNGEKNGRKTTVVKLGLNYRSSPQIIQTADKLIRHCEGRTPIEFGSTKPPGELVKCVKFEKPELEAEAVGTSIENTIKTGTPPREIAVFFRTNDMSRLIEQSLAKRQIPYQVVGSGSYYDRMEVKDVLSMLRFVCNPKDGISFHRVANKPARGMGDALIGRLETFAEMHKLDILTTLQERNLEFIRDENDKPLAESALRACRETRHVFDLEDARMTVAQIATELFHRSHYENWLQSRYEDKGEFEDRLRNVHELLNAIAEFARTHPRATVAEYLESISLYTQGDALRGEENAVRLMSLHASKGLEFDVVYLLGLEHKILPHEKALADRAEAGLSEERRLCYVGFTRARKILRVTWCENRPDVYARAKAGKFKSSIPSQFLVEAGLMTSEEYTAAMKNAGFTPATATRPKLRKKSKSAPSRPAMNAKK